MVSRLKLFTHRVLYCLLILCTIIGVMFYISQKRTPRKLIKTHCNIDLCWHYNIDVFTDTWGWNGDGETFIIITIPQDAINKIELQCIKNRFNSLPIKDSLQDNIIYKYLSDENKGYYMLKKDHNNNRNYMIAIFNESTNKFILHYILY